ncbi:hypothetical protein DENSPDRAFT_887115 [Dentipellis sp. KUC8613]|nr:hypothetical protein DENSPDRAFT_887115 [Dentipellis sp. KUC8613]
MACSALFVPHSALCALGRLSCALWVHVVPRVAAVVCVAPYGSSPESAPSHHLHLSSLAARPRPSARPSLAPRTPAPPSRSPAALLRPASSFGRHRAPSLFPCVAVTHPRLLSHAVMCNASPFLHSRHAPSRCHHVLSASSFAATRSCAAVTRPMPPSRAHHPPSFHPPTPPFHAVSRRLTTLLRRAAPSGAPRHHLPPDRVVARPIAWLRALSLALAALWCAVALLGSLHLLITTSHRALVPHGAIWTALLRALAMLWRPTTPSRPTRT